MIHTSLPEKRHGIIRFQSLLIGIFVSACMLFASAKAQNPDTLLRHFDEAVSMEYAQDAHQILDTLQTIAVQQHDELLQFRVNYNRALLLAQYDENHGYAAILFIDSVMQDSRAPYQNLYQYFLFQLLRQYREQNSFIIHGRSNLSKGNVFLTRQQNQADSLLPLSDLHLYGDKDIDLLINRSLSRSLQNAEILQQIPTEAFSFMIEQQANAGHYRPTLFDFILQTVLDELSQRKPTKEDMDFVARHYDELAQPDWYRLFTADTGNVGAIQQYVQLIQQALLVHSALPADEDVCVDYEITKLNQMNVVLQNSQEANRKMLTALDKLQAHYAAADSIPILYCKAVNLYTIAVQELKNPEAQNVQDTFARSHQLLQIVSQKGEPWISNNASYYIEQLDKIELSIQPMEDFYPQAKLLCPIAYKRIDTLYLTIKRVDIPTYKKFDMNLSYNYVSLTNKEWAFLHSLETFRVDTFVLRNGSDYYMHYTDLFVDSLPIGKYCMLAHCRPLQDSDDVRVVSLISVTKIRVLGQQTNSGKSLIWALDAYDGTPLAHAVVGRNNGNRGSKYRLTNAKGYAKVGRGTTVSVKYKKKDFFQESSEYGDFYDESGWYRHFRPHRKHSWNTVLLFTDRSIYRPGQQVFFKTILGHNNKKVYRHQNVQVVLKDPHKNAVDTIFLKTNDYGSADSCFTLPDHLTLGRYELLVQDERGTQYTRLFFVEAYKRPTFEVVLKPIEGEYRSGDTVTIEGYVRTFSGVPVANADVHCAYNMVGSRGLLTTISDYAGNFSFRIPIISSDYSVVVNADVYATDFNGETYSADQLRIDCYSKSLKLSAQYPEFFNKDQKGLITGSLTIMNSDFSVLDKSYTIDVSKIRTPNRAFVYHKMPDRPLYSETEYQHYFPCLSGDERLTSSYRKDWDTEKFVGSFACSSPNWSIDPSGWDAGYYQLEFKVPSAYGDTVCEKYNITVFSDKVFDSDEAIHILTEPVYSGRQPAKFTVCSSLDSANVIYGIFLGKKLKAVKHFNTKDGEAQTDSIVLHNRPISVFAMSAHKEKFFKDWAASPYVDTSARAIKKITKYFGKGLNLELSHYTDQMNPGQKEKWELRVSRKDTAKMSDAEVMAWMYDASLDKLKSNSYSDIFHNWPQAVHIPPKRRIQQPFYTFIDYKVPIYCHSSKKEKLTLSPLAKRYPNFIRDFSHSRVPDVVKGDLLQLQSGNSVIKGHVTDEMGEPLAYSQILLEEGGIVVNVAVSDENGDYCLSGVKPGVYDVVADAMMTCKKSLRKTDVFVYGGSATFVDFSIYCSSELSEVVVMYEPPASYNNNVCGYLEELVADEYLIRDEKSDAFDNKEDKDESERQLTQWSGKVQPRTNFSELAFFYPRLRTNEKGQVVFEFDAPEQLTRWRFLALAHTRDWYWDTLTQDVVTQRSLMVVPNCPRFLREDDSLLFQVRISNTSSKALKGMVRLVWTNPETEQPVAILQDAERQSFACDSMATANVSWRLKVPAGLSSLKYKVVAVGLPENAADNISYSDGEERVVPILPNNIKVLESTPFYVRRDSVLRVKPDYTVSDNAQQESWQVVLNTNAMWSACQALPYLIERRHSCNEQIFAKLFAETLALSMLRGNPALSRYFERALEDSSMSSPLVRNEDLKSILIEETPWLQEAETETEYLQRTASLLDVDKMEQDTKRLKRLLEQNQKADGSWGWFGSFGSNPFITQHILAGIAHLGLIGSDGFQLRTQDKAVSAIHQWAYGVYRAFQDDTNKNKQFRFDNIHAHYLYTASFYPLPDSEHLIFFLDSARRAYRNFGYYTQAELTIAFYRMGMREEAQNWAKALQQKAHRKNGMVYWTAQSYGNGEYYAYRDWHELPIETHAMLMEAMIEILPENTEQLKKEKCEMVTGMRQWLLNQREGRHWNTTKGTTEAVYAIIRANRYLDSNAVAPQRIEASTDVVITSGEHTFTHPDTVLSATYELDKTPDEVTIGNHSNDDVNGSIRHLAAIPLRDLGTSQNTELSIVKKLYREVGSSASLQEIADSATIRVGEKIIVRLAIQTNRTIEYVHLKDMRAAAFEPEDVLSRYRWAGELYFYQSPSDASMNFFFDRIEKGSYVVEYAVRATQTGTFNNGVATIQCMYAPDFTAHSAYREVSVER